MGVRVKVRVKSVDLIALVNTGYETDVPEILVPLDIAEKLGCFSFIIIRSVCVHCLKAYKVF